MNNQEDQHGGSQLLNIMKSNLEEEQDEEETNNFSPNFQSLNSEQFNNNVNQEKNKNKQDTSQNYDDFLNAGGDKLISNLAKLNLGNNSSNQNSNISPKKIESNNYFQNPMVNKNMNNKKNQKDLAFNYYFGSGIQGDPSNKGGESGGQTVSSQILEHLGLNVNNDNNDINEQQFKNYFNNQGQGNENNNINKDEKIENNMYKFNKNNINQNPQGKIMMNFQNKNNNNNINQKMDFNVNENMIMQNQNNNNTLNNINNLNINNQMMQMNNNMNMGINLPYNNMDPRIRNIIQQNMMRNNMMNNMQMNQNQIKNLNNQNNMQPNQKNQNNKNKKKKNKNNKSNNNNNNNNNVNIQNMNLMMNKQQPQMINYQNVNQLIPNQNIQNINPMLNYPSSQNPQINFTNRGLTLNNNALNRNLNNLQNIQNYNMNIQQQKNYMQHAQNEGGYMQNNIPMQIMNYNPAFNYNQVNLDQIINRANISFPGKFFVIKSIDESNIMSSIRFKIWCSTIKGNQKLQKAYKEADKKYPIFLFFSVNGSGKFMGIAIMNSDVEYKVNFNYWSQSDKWKGFFLVEWICIKDVPNRMFKTIINDLNENKPVTSSRDTQEICTSAGVKMLKVFKDYPNESTIFDSQANEMKYMLQQQNEQNNMNNFGNMNINKGNMYNNIGNPNHNIGNMNNNIGNLNNMGNINNNNYNMNNIGYMNNMVNMNNMGNLGNYNQMMKMNVRKMDMNYSNNNNMKENKNNNQMNNNNTDDGNDFNNFANIQMEMNNQDKINSNNEDDIKNNSNEHYDFKNILGRKNDEDEGEESNK